MGDIIQESSFFLVARTEAGYQKGISVRALKDQYGLTDLATYQHQARLATGESMTVHIFGRVPMEVGT